MSLLITPPDFSSFFNRFEEMHSNGLAAANDEQIDLIQSMRGIIVLDIDS